MSLNNKLFGGYLFLLIILYIPVCGEWEMFDLIFVLMLVSFL